MLAFPASFLILPVAVALGMAYLRAEKLARARLPARAVLLAAVCTLPFFTRGPGQAQLILGLCVGYLGLRMVALAQRPRRPGLARAALDLIHLEPLFEPRATPWPRPFLLLARGLVELFACIVFLVAGQSLRVWELGLWGRLLDDVVVFAEVAVGASGLHHLVVGIAGLAGRHVLGLLNHPFHAPSLTDFWARRWNRLVQRHLDEGFFRPLVRAGYPRLGLLAAFFASGILHLLVLSDAAAPAIQVRVGLQVMAFFLLHGCMLLIERRLGWHRPPLRPVPLFLARIRSLAIFVLLSPLLLDPFAAIAHVHGRRLDMGAPTLAGKQPSNVPSSVDRATAPN